MAAGKGGRPKAVQNCEKKMGVTPHYKVLAEWGPVLNKISKLSFYKRSASACQGIGVHQTRRGN